MATSIEERIETLERRVAALEDRNGTLELKAVIWDQIMPAVMKMDGAMRSSDDELWLCCSSIAVAFASTPTDPKRAVEAVLTQMISDRSDRTSPKLQSMLEAIQGGASQQAVERALKLVVNNDDKPGDLQ